MTEKSITQQLEAGERARLIPVTNARQKELAAVSVVLAVFRIVPAYAKLMLEEVGAPWSKRSKNQDTHNSDAESKDAVLLGPAQARVWGTSTPTIWLRDRRELGLRTGPPITS